MLRERNWSIAELKLFVSELGERDPELVNELRAAGAPATLEGLPPAALGLNRAVGGPEAAAAGQDPGVLESIIVAQGRPVLAIINNQIDTAKIRDPMAPAIRKRLDAAKRFLDPAIPVIGRVELTNNPQFEWVGTSWLIDDDILVTNRHVAEVFAVGDGARFVFRPGLDPTRPQTARVDFLEEIDRTDTLERPIAEIVWIAPPNGPDVAFLKLAGKGSDRVRPIALDGALPKKDDQVCVIGYPARDSRIPDSKLMDRMFGEVYDKKRLSPGQIIGASDTVVQHDCTTLGGNSGSAVLSLATGRALALHFSGTFMRSNFAVPAAVLVKLMRERPWHPSDGRRGEQVVTPAPVTPTVGTPAGPADGSQAGQPAGGANITTIPGGVRLSMPLTIDVRIGGDGLGATVGVGTTGSGTAPSAPGAPAPGGPATAPGTTTGDSKPPTLADVAASLRDKLRERPDVVSVREGYAFRDGWITDERAVVVRVRPDSKLSTESLGVAETVGGVPVEVRPADPTELAAVEHGMTEAPHKFVSNYKRKLTGKFALAPVKGKMRIVAHASPDAGWPVLQDFLAGVDRNFVLAMYDLSAPHIVTKFTEELRGTARRKKSFKLVLDPNESFGEGTKAKDLSEAAVIKKIDAVDNLDFENAFASVSGPKRLFDSAYHIKVGVKDGARFWLSSGNMQSSNQPNLKLLHGSTDPKPLRTFNREWHVVLNNEKLARTFQAHIEQDFEDALNVPEIPGAPAQPDVLVPIELLELPDEELPARVEYFEPLDINEEMEVQPLLTPDNYLEPVLDLIESAEHSVLFQNQSFKPGAGGANSDDFDKLLKALLRKQKQGDKLDVRIIFRKIGDVPDTLERLKDFGFDTRRTKLRVQTNCHNKGIVVDGERVLIGSQNWTNAGTKFNRDASLIIANKNVAKYFAGIFEFDWGRIGNTKADTTEGMAREARLVMPGEEAAVPKGYVRMTWHEWTGE